MKLNSQTRYCANIMSNRGLQLSCKHVHAGTKMKRISILEQRQLLHEIRKIDQPQTNTASLMCFTVT